MGPKDSGGAVQPLQFGNDPLGDGHTQGTAAMATMMENDGRQSVPRDPAMAALRMVILLAGIAYTAVESDPAHKAILIQAFMGFTAYGIALYALGYRMLAKGAGGPFYLTAAVLDLSFAVLVIWATGGASSPFFRALYLWVAILAFLFGLRVGVLGSIVAFAVLLLFDLKAGFPAEPLPVLLQAGGLLMHGPLVGFLAERERSRAEMLRQARDQLAEANQRLVAEQAKLIQAEKLSSIGLLAAGVAHEINNPLTGVMGCAKALRDGISEPERRAEYWEAVHDGLERMRGTVQSLLDFARQRPPAPTEQDAGEVVQSCVRLLQPLERKKDLKVDNRVAAGAALVQADRAQLMQALVNVMMNSIHAAPQGSAVVVSARAEGDLVGIRIEDSGGGIPQEQLKKVCDPFFTTKPEGEGTGLGLAITLSIVRAHGGDLAIESEVGKGTAVTLWLPKSRQEVARGS
jgi:signal transduction histidine kinase